MIKCCSNLKNDELVGNQSAQNANEKEINANEKSSGY
jgi:hypothetical protein